MSLTPKMGICEICGKERMIKSRKCAVCHRTVFRSYTKRKPRLFKKDKEKKELEFFKELWADEKNRPRVSFLSDKPILHFSPWCMSHVLPKGSYGLYRLNPDNVIYLTPREHFEWHNIPRSELIAKNPRWAKVFDLYEELKIRYNNENK